MGRKAKPKLNERYISTIEYNDSQDYNCAISENVFFMRRIISCLKGERSEEEVEQLIGQLENKIIENINDAKIKQGSEGYPGLLIKE